MTDTLPGGFQVGHWSDREGWTGCTVVLAPDREPWARAKSGAAGRGRARATSSRPRPRRPGPQAVLLTGGSAFGLAAADGVVRITSPSEGGLPHARRERCRSSPARSSSTSRSGTARPGPTLRRAMRPATAARERGRRSGGVSASGTGCTVGQAPRSRALDEGRPRLRGRRARRRRVRRRARRRERVRRRARGGRLHLSPGCGATAPTGARSNSSLRARPAAPAAGESTTLVCLAHGRARSRRRRPGASRARRARASPAPSTRARPRSTGTWSTASPPAGRARTTLALSAGRSRGHGRRDQGRRALARPARRAARPPSERRAAGAAG